MGVKDLGLFGMVILGGLALGWMTPGETTIDPARNPDGGATSPQADATGMAGTGALWPNGSPVPPGERDLPSAAPDPVAEQMRNDARASFRSEMAKSGVTDIRVAPERGIASTPPPQAIAAAPTQAQAAGTDSAPASSGWSSPTSGAGGWGVQAGVPPSTGPMAPPSSAQPAQHSN